MVLNVFYVDYRLVHGYQLICLSDYSVDFHALLSSIYVDYRLLHGVSNSCFD